ncbi:MAG: peptide chain release factor N(5)-glutamine methyltransferase [Deltaproteobacteria bacterium]|nr:peptide chain release factor N(5)-glutamine methyltransferase [Deltaproteobacteria bacterium]
MSGAETWTVLDLLRWTTAHFGRQGIDSPRLDAECLLAHALATDRLRLYLEFDKPVEESERARFRELVRRRGAERIPVAHLTGRKEFWSLPLRVTRDVLTPRPDTETLVQAALGNLSADGAAGTRILDVGTGSGAIALALLSERPKLQAVATDVCAAALAVAEENAGELGLLGRIDLRRGPLFEPVAGERFDLVVSNPPYLAAGEAGDLAAELAHEPGLALFAGPAGTELLEALVAGASPHLVPEGSLLLEVAPAQASVVAGWMRAAGFENIRVHDDLGRRPRVVSGRLARRGGDA